MQTGGQGSKFAGGLSGKEIQVTVMIVIISPAKTLDYQSPLATKKFTHPELLSKAQELIQICRQLTPIQLTSLMGISNKLAQLNAARFNSWQPARMPADNARQALLAFKGDVYTSLQAEDFHETDFAFAQQHLRILSGLYGVLRPLDLIQPYRLEMGTRLMNPRGQDLYSFWGNLLTEKLNQTLAEAGTDTLINLASDEYFNAIQPDKLKGTLIKPVFLDEKEGKYKIISFYAKKARGLMSRYIIQHRCTCPEQLFDFNLGGYRCDPALSHNTAPVFKRAQTRL